ncbi:MAG: hypothetical protein IID32_10920, partial [Planctomycetes bacterium]|nr:hypothetical protein [Planctomycetota bacterium]
TIPAKPAPKQAKPSSTDQPNSRLPNTTPSATDPRKTDSTQTAEKTTVIEPHIVIPPPSPNDIVKLKLTNNLLDLNYLIDYVGKVMEFNFIYDTTSLKLAPVKLQLYGDLHRKDLVPLLDTLLSFQGYTLVRDDPWIRIIKQTSVHRVVEPLLRVGDDLKPPEPGDSIVAQMVEIKYIPVKTAIAFLTNFTTKLTYLQVPNTNQIIITEYSFRLPRLLKMLSLIDQPGPQRTLTVIPVIHITADSARLQVENLIKNLKTQVIGTTTTPAIPPRPIPQRPGRPSSRPQPTPTRQAITPTGKTAMTLLVDKRINRLLVIATEGEREQVMDLLALLDIPDGPEIKLVPIQVQHLLAGDVATQITRLLQALKQSGASTTITVPKSVPRPPTRQGQPGRPTTPPIRTAVKKQTTPTPTGPLKKNDPYIYVDDRINRLLVVGSDEQIDRVKSLLALLDVSGGPEIRLQPLPIRYLLAKDVAAQMTQLMNALNQSGYTAAPATSSAPTPPAPRQPRPAVPRALPTRAKTPQSVTTASVKSKKNQPFLYVDDRLNRLLVIGSDTQIDQVKSLLDLLDVPDGTDIKLEVLTPKYVLSQNVTSKILELINALNQGSPSQETTGSTPAKTPKPPAGPTGVFSPKRPLVRPAKGPTTPSATSPSLAMRSLKKSEPYMLIDDRVNRFFVIGSDEQIKQVKDLLLLLDVPDGPEIKLEVLTLKYVMANEVSAEITQLIEALNQGIGRDESTPTASAKPLPKQTKTTTPTPPKVKPPAAPSTPAATDASENVPYLHVDDRINRLFVIGSDDQIKQVKDLLVLLDVPAGPEIKLVVMPLKHV